MPQYKYKGAFLAKSPRALANGVAVLVLLGSLIFYVLCLRFSKMYYRFLIPGLLLFALSICEYYNRTSLSYPIGGRISRTVGQMDIFIMFGSLLSVLAVPVIVYFLYNLQYYNLGTATSYLLSYGVLALSFINGYCLSYYYGTYKQNMNKFSYITPLRYALFILLFTPVISEYFCGAKYFCAFPIALMYVIGVFTKSFTRNYKKPVNIFFFVFGIVALIYLGMNVQNLITNISVNSNVGA